MNDRDNKKSHSVGPYNIVILTTGLSGSSVLAGLFKRAGYWSGNKTVVKNNTTGNYDTFESEDFVKLNSKLCELAGYEFTSCSWYQSADREIFEKLSSNIDSTSFNDFLSDNQQKSPWVFKDPKCWLTIGYWAHFIDKENTKFIILCRNIFGLWLSQVYKRIIYDFKFLSKSESQAKQDLARFLEKNGFEFIEVNYETLVKNTEKEVLRINTFAHSEISISDWNSIYKSPPLFENLKRLILSPLIYLKNYKGRIY